MGQLTGPQGASKDLMDPSEGPLKGSSRPKMSLRINPH